MQRSISASALAGRADRRSSIRLSRTHAAVALLSAIGVVEFFHPVAQAATQTSTWEGTTNTSWSTATNWSPNNTDPSNGNAGISDFDVLIQSVANEPILNVNATIDLLTVNASSTLSIAGGSSLSILQSANVNNGLINVNYNNSGASTLSFTNAALTGTGTIVLSSSGTNAVLAGTLSQASGNSINGYGTISASLTNNGTVDASVANQTLFISAGATNNNLMEATAGGSTLNVNGVTISQSSGGAISANGGTVVLNGAVIAGGTLETNGSNVINASNSNLNGVTVAANSTVNVVDGSTVSLGGNTTTVNGSIIVDNNGGSHTALNVASNMLLTGTGTVTLNNNSPAASLTTSATNTLTIGASATINGTGEIDALLVNNGTIDASVANRVLALATNPMTNNKLIEATAAGSTLEVNGITVTQGSSGTISAVNAPVLLGNATISGGTLTSTGATLFASGTTTLSGVTITSGSLVNIPNGSTAGLAGSTITNNGTITVDTFGGAQTVLNIDNSLALAGTGTLTLNNYSPQAQLNGASGVILTVNSGQTINGTGQTNVAITNNGTIDASVANHLLVLQTDPISNNSLIESNAPGATLEVNGVTVTQATTATISAASSPVLLNAATIVGGTLNAAAGQVITVSGGTLNAVTINAGSSLAIADLSTVGFAGSTITNNGTITVDNEGTAAGVNINNTLTLTGTGTLALNNYTLTATLNGTGSALLTNDTHQLIDGTGEIGVSLLNKGTVDADFANHVLLLQTNAMTNDNVLEATGPGSTLEVNGITVTQNASGEFAALGGTVLLNNAGVSGGLITGNTAVDISGTTGVLTNVTIAAGTSVLLEQSSTVGLAGTSITNNGHFTISQNGGTVTDLNVNNSLTLTGTGTLSLFNYGPNAEITSSTGAVLTVDTNQLIDGVGEIDAAVTNNGTINADYANHTLLLQTKAMTNNNVMEATAGGSTLEINGITINQGTSGVVEANGGNVWLTGNASIDNGTLTTDTTGNFIYTSGASLSNVTLSTASKLTLLAGSTLNVSGSLVNNGLITVDQFSSNADLNFPVNTSVTGTGTIALADYNPNALITTPSTATVTLGAGQTLNGVGAIQANLINNGIVNASYANHGIVVQTDNVANNNLMEATGGGSSLVISGITVTQASGASISAAGGNVIVQNGAAIVGGTLTSNAGNNIQVTSGTFTNLTIAATSNVIVEPSDTLNLNGSTITNNGTITVDQFSGNAALNIASSLTLAGTGTVVLDDYNPNARVTGSAGATLTIGAGQIINGVGEVDVPTINNGTIAATFANHALAINAATNGPGTLGSTGANTTLQLGPSSGGSSASSLTISAGDRLDITNNHLFVNYQPGHDPIASIAALILSGYAGGAWTGNGIMSSTAASNAGSYGIGFADSADTGNPAGLASNQIEIKYTLLGDANLDGKVNGADFAILATNFNKSVSGVSGWDQGDFNYDGKINGADFAFLASNFNKGASQSATDLAALDSFAQANDLSLPTSVPEPTFGALALLAAGGVLTRRRARAAR